VAALAKQPKVHVENRHPHERAATDRSNFETTGNAKSTRGEFLGRRLQMSIGTILLIILVIALLGGFSGIGGGRFYGGGPYVGGGLGLVIVILLILVLLGRL
jgi:hypothetical protein